MTNLGFWAEMVYIPYRPKKFLFGQQLNHFGQKVNHFGQKKYQEILKTNLNKSVVNSRVSFSEDELAERVITIAENHLLLNLINWGGGCFTKRPNRKWSRRLWRIWMEFPSFWRVEKTSSRVCRRTSKKSIQFRAQKIKILGAGKVEAGKVGAGLTTYLCRQ